MRCGRCGNANAEGNRFCGTCGAPLAAQVQSATQPSSAASAGSAAPPVSKTSVQDSQIATMPPAPAPTRPAPLPSPRPEPRRVQGITGPSFLGLNQGSGGGSHRDHYDTSTGHEPLESSSGSLDYLLEDEEEPKGGVVKLFLVVVLIAVAIGIGYLRWMRGSFDFLGIKKAEVTTSTDAVPNSSGSTLGTSSAPNSTSPNAPVTPIPTDSGAPTPPNSDAANAGSTASSSQGANPAPVPDAAQPAQPAPADAPAATTNSSGAAADSAPQSSASDAQAESSDEEPPVPAPDKSVARKPAKLPKPSAAKPVSAMSNDSVVEAERYIYGRGAAQDCDHGLRLLKPAALQQNPKAMISLGALYSTGTCTPRDLPTAYRWFAMALHKQPDNQVLQNDLQRLWSQMTQPERQLAIKLSQ